jgi:hypothetical protein
MNDPENAAPGSNIFEAELGRQILVSERERASLQALIGVALLLISVVKAVHVATANPWPAFNAALAVVAILIVYELAMRQLFDRYLRQDRQLAGYPASRCQAVARRRGSCADDHRAG